MRFIISPIWLVIIHRVFQRVIRKKMSRRTEQYWRGGTYAESLINTLNLPRPFTGSRLMAALVLMISSKQLFSVLNNLSYSTIDAPYDCFDSTNFHQMAPHTEFIEY